MKTFPTARRTAAIALAIASAVALSACASTATPSESGAAGDDEVTTLKIATVGLLADGAVQLGIAEGFFEEEGLAIETSLVANPPAGLAAAQSGQVDLAYAPSVPVLNALSQGVPLKIVAAADGYPDGAADEADADSLDDSGLYASAKSGITEIEQLEGKTVAVPARKAQLEVTISAALTEAGVDPASVNWVVLDFTSAAAALESGTVDAAGLVTPFTDQAAQAGATFIASPGIQFFREGAVGLWVAGESTVTGKADAIAAFQRAIAKTNAYANENPDDAVQAGIDFTESTLTVEEATVPYWPTEVRSEDIERVNDQLVSLGFLASPVALDGVILPKP